MFVLGSSHRTIIFDEVCFDKGQTTDELQHMRDEQRRQEEIRSQGQVFGGEQQKTSPPRVG